MPFITCEGLILSAVVAWLIINHSADPIRWWLMVDLALSGHPSVLRVAICSAGPLYCTALVADCNCWLCVHKSRSVVFIGHNMCRATMCQLFCRPKGSALCSQFDFARVWTEAETVHYLSAGHRQCGVWAEHKNVCALKDKEDINVT